jgi:hypothetical protein
LPRVRTPTTISTVSKTPVTIRAAAQTLALACDPPPDGAAAASPAPRATVTRPTAHQVIRGSLRWASLLATSRVNGSSMMKMGCTSATGPVASAVAWHTEARTTMAMPISHTLRLIR